MSLSDRLKMSPLPVVLDTRRLTRKGQVHSVQLQPTKTRVADAAVIDRLVSEHESPSILVTAKGTVWLLSDPGDGVVWFVGHGKPTKVQRTALELLLSIMAAEFPDVDVPLLDDEEVTHVSDE
jgi:hypothetical protein